MGHESQVVTSADHEPASARLTVLEHDGLPTRIGREKVDESLQIINKLRASCGLPPTDRALLDLDMFISIDMRLTKDINFGGSRRLQLFLEGTT